MRREISEEQQRKETGEVALDLLEREIALKSQGYDYPKVGDIYLSSQDSEVPVEWLVADVSEEKGFKVVALDSHPFVGSHDIELDYDTLKTVARLRCSVVGWVQASRLLPELKTGVVSRSYTNIVRNQLRMLQEGKSPSRKEDIDCDPEYQSWLDELREVLNRFSDSSAGLPEKESFDSLALGEGVCVDREYRLASHMRFPIDSLLLTTAFVLAKAMNSLSTGEPQTIFDLVSGAIGSVIISLFNSHETQIQLIFLLFVQLGILIHLDLYQPWRWVTGQDLSKLVWVSAGALAGGLLIWTPYAILITTLFLDAFLSYSFLAFIRISRRFLYLSDKRVLGWRQKAEEHVRSSQDRTITKETSEEVLNNYLEHKSSSIRYHYPRELRIISRGHEYRLTIGNISAIESSGHGTCRVRTHSNVYIINKSIHEIDKTLNPTDWLATEGAILQRSHIKHKDRRIIVMKNNRTYRSLPQELDRVA